MDSSWKKGFLDKLGEAQKQWLRDFDTAMDEHVSPGYDEVREFLSNNGFRVSKPLREEGRRSFKFELAENAYVLVLFRAAGVNEFEIRAETFVPAREPVLSKAMARVKDLNMDWAQEQFQTALDNFVSLLSGDELVPEDQELVAV